MPNPFDTGIRLTVVAPTEGRTRCDVDEFVLCPTNARADAAIQRAERAEHARDEAVREAIWRIENETRAAGERDKARAEVARLRRLIHDALDRWATTGDVDYAMGAMHKEAAGE